MKILHLSYFENFGGAARAANRIHQSLLENNIKSKMMVFSKSSNNKNIICPFGDVKRKLNNLIIRFLYFFIFRKKFHNTFSINFFNSGIVKFINNSEFDIINFHWINHEMISLDEIEKIKKPIVWTLHDQWPYLGIEHYCKSNDLRFKKGYTRNNSSLLEYKTWCKKRDIFSKKIDYIISPSKWNLDKSKKSKIFKKKKHKLIPYPIISKNFKIKKKTYAIKKLNLRSKKKIIISFGATSAISDQRKGFDFVFYAIKELNKKYNHLMFLIFGEKSKNLKKIKNVINYDQIKSEKKLSDIYSASDIVLLPSIQDNLPLVAIESLMSATPVVSFNVGGLKDIIINKKNGYLAMPFDKNDFVKGIEYFISLNIKDKKNYLRNLEYKKTYEYFEPKRIANQYKKIYREVMSN